VLMNMGSVGPSMCALILTYLLISYCCIVAYGSNLILIIIIIEFFILKREMADKNA
jgi:hypothetical protein